MKSTSKSLAFALCVSFIVSGCGAPSFRTPNSLPRAQVFARIKCELYRAVVSVNTLQEGDYKDVAKQFPLGKYAVELTLGEKSTSESGAAIGGNIYNTGKSKGLLFGSGAFPGVGVSSTDFQYNNGTRLLLVKDIVADFKKPKPSPGQQDTSFYRNCSDKRINLLGISQNLGILQRLTTTLGELKTSPGIVSVEEYNFDFTVNVSAGGTISFVEPVKEISLGAGAAQTYNESLNLKFTLLGKG